jgi:hypothetical protein
MLDTVELDLRRFLPGSLVPRPGLKVSLFSATNLTIYWLPLQFTGGLQLLRQLEEVLLDSVNLEDLQVMPSLCERIRSLHREWQNLL